MGRADALQEVSGCGSILADVKTLASSNPKGEEPMKRFAMAIALGCVLSVSAFAGDSPSGGYAPPSPDESTQTTTTLVALGDSPTGGYTDQTSTDTMLSIVQTVLSLLSV
jgi:hypothetical protein